MRVYTGGTFDIPHFGHARFLERCAQFGSVTVALNTDAFIEVYKQKTPIFTYEERKAILELSPYVDNVVENFGGADSKPAIELVRPDLIIVGSDWARRDYHRQMGFTQDWLDARGIGLLYIPYTQNISSSEIIRRIGDRNLV